MGWVIFFVIVIIIVISVNKSKRKLNKLPEINRSQSPIIPKIKQPAEKKPAQKKTLYEDDYPDDELEGNENSKFINTKVVGTTYKNKDRTSRQRIIKECKVGEKLLLIQSPDERNNDEIEYEDGIKVFRQNNEQLGWLAEYLASEIIELFEKGCKADATITNITGGTEEKPTIGCNL